MGFVFVDPWKEQEVERMLDYALSVTILFWFQPRYVMHHRDYARTERLVFADIVDLRPCS